MTEEKVNGSLTRRAVLGGALGLAGVIGAGSVESLNAATRAEAAADTANVTTSTTTPSSTTTTTSPSPSQPAPYYPSTEHDQPTVLSVPLEYRSPTLTPFVDPVPILPRRSLGGTIAMAEMPHKFHRDLPAVPSWGYGGVSHLGPVIEVQRGERIPTTFANRLGANILAQYVDTSLMGTSPIDLIKPPTVVHLHGAPNHPQWDGYPTGTIRPGQELTDIFNPDVAATMLWYHDHAMGETRLNVYAGLAAPFIVRDGWDSGREDNPLGLPSGRYEVPLVVCDKVLNNDGTLNYQANMLLPKNLWGGGLCGDLIVVNGKVWPYLDVDRGIYRLRIVNAAQLNDYRLELSNGAPFWVIGSDGGLLDEPASVGAVDIAPAERYDLLIDFSELGAGDTVELINTMQIAVFGQVVGAHSVPNIMQFVGTGRPAPVRNVPTQLRGGVMRPPALAALETPTATRTSTLNVTFYGIGVEPGIDFILMNLSNLRFSDPGFETPVQGTIERWDLVNADLLGEMHDMHVHLVQFRVLGRTDFASGGYHWNNPTPQVGTFWAPPPDGYLTGALQPPAPYEAGWKDTVRCPPGQVTSVIVRWPTAAELGFDPDAMFHLPVDDWNCSPPSSNLAQGYVWHCHLMDHEDNEMMHRLRIIAPP